MSGCFHISSALFVLRVLSQNIIKAIYIIRHSFFVLCQNSFFSSDFELVLVLGCMLGAGEVEVMVAGECEI